MKRRRQGNRGFVPPYAEADALEALELLRTQDELVQKLVTPDLEPLFSIGQSET